MEIVLKGLLLLRDYDKHHSKLKDLGHHLDKIADVAAREYGLPPVRDPVLSELKALSSLYAKHFLRYGSFYDVLVNPATIQCKRALHRMLAVLKLAERELQRK
jgi:hypothetical protein